MKYLAKSVMVLVTIAFLSALLIGWGSKDSEKLVIGTMPLTVGVPVQYAYDKGYYEEEGLDVEIKIFSTGAPINEAYAAKQIDIAVSGLASVFSLALPDTAWIGEINTGGGVGIYVRPDSELLSYQGEVSKKPGLYGTVEKIKGMEILGPLGTVSQFNAIRYVQSFGLTSEDYEQIHMEYGPAYQAFASGEGDAVSLVPPFSFQAEEAGYKMIASFEEATECELVDGIFISKKLAKERREDVVRFIRATYRAAAELQDNDILFEFAHKWFNDNGKVYDLKTLESEYSVRDYIDKTHMLQDGYVFGKGMKEVGNFFTEDKKISQDMFPNIVKSFDPSFIYEALDINFEVQN